LPLPTSLYSTLFPYTTLFRSEAVDLFTGYTERKPENPWGFYMLGLASWKAGNLAQAGEAFDQALKLDPKHQKSLLNSARVLLERSEEHTSELQSRGHLVCRLL